MSPREQNILDTLNVLVLVHRAHKQMHPKLTEEEQHTIKITKEHLTIAKLTIPVFINTLHELDKKGYLMAITIFEDKYHPEILKFLDDAEYSKITDALQQVDTSKFIDTVKVAIADLLEKNVPRNAQLHREEVLNEDLDIKTLLDSGRSIFEGHTSETVAAIVFSPFRSTERLLEKMNDGTRFDDIKDAGVWYDAIAYELHFDDTTIATAYNNKPNKEHFALAALFSQFGEQLIDYDDIPEFDSENKDKEMKSYRDSLNRFIKKHPRLSEIFTVHADHLAIHEGYLEQPH